MDTSLKKNKETGIGVRLNVLEKFMEEVVENENKERKERSRMESETAYWQARAEMPSA